MQGGRVRKDDPAVEALGDVDEAQAALGVARAHVTPGSELDGVLVDIERGLWALMGELAGGGPAVTAEMVAGLEGLIDDVAGRFAPPSEFVVPGQSAAASFLDLARTIVRRAERRALAVTSAGSQVVPYLNRLSDLLWTLARWEEDVSLPARAPGTAPPSPPEERP